ncbi:ABC transporter permease [Agrobacterium rosae]|uniref:ABC transporter permease n=1 Tax=Agrobacterium rosae TaxID=1972867 RepID=UPI0020333A48|nr:ABC transporter permease subunit [Agrobacterium rosae]MCM2435771.1 ABC transporter permease subunit [Agrobacterium rosae]
MDLQLLQTFGPAMLRGVVVTLELVGVSTVFGILLAIPLALARNSQINLISGAAKAYIVFVRGTPLLAQIFLLYYGAGQLREHLQALNVWWIFRDAWVCAIIAFTMNTAAYQAEILRAALTTLPPGQTEAAQAIGLSKWYTFAYILLPQAMILALRPFGNELILLIKASALASIITVPELMQATRVAFSRTFDFQIYIWTAAIYLVMVETIRRFWLLAENRFTRHLQAAP